MSSKLSSCSFFKLFIISHLLAELFWGITGKLRDMLTLSNDSNDFLSHVFALFQMISVFVLYFVKSFISKSDGEQKICFVKSILESNLAQLNVLKKINFPVCYASFEYFHETVNSIL